MSDWKWEAEIGAGNGGSVVNVGCMSEYGTEAEAEARARSVIGKTVKEFREHPDSDVYGDAFEHLGAQDDWIVTGATVQRYNEDGIDWDSTRDLS